MVKYGMTPIEVICSATTSIAASLGRSPDLGDIMLGRFTNLVTVQGDALEGVDRLRHVSAVIWKGHLVKQEGAR